jgi:hypothetical protein
MASKASDKDLGIAGRRPELIVDTDGHVRILTINRPSRMNSFSPTLAVGEPSTPTWIRMSAP